MTKSSDQIKHSEPLVSTALDLHSITSAEYGGSFSVLPTRSKDESKEDKAARKHAVKEQKQARRTEKKVMKETFTREKQLQVKVAIGKQMSGAGLKKL